MTIMTLESLAQQVASGQIDTVLVAFVDMQGRLMGKRFHAAHFLDSAGSGTHCCNYLIATDLDMATPEGYDAVNWQKGFGDYALKPDLATLRPVPWLNATALVICDLFDPATDAPIALSPRQILRTQIERARAMGFEPMMATELEFFLFARSYDEIRASGWRDLETLVRYNQDYSIQFGAREEHIMQPVRNALYAMGVPVENTKGEAEAGQHELNIRYADGMLACDQHVISKQAVKEIAFQKGHGATFMAKWQADKVGSAAHLHQSLFEGGRNVFHDPKGDHGMSGLMRSYVAGLLKYAPDCLLLMAPYINSYKRFVPGTFAPTRIAWSVDNRTAGFRLVGENTRAVRVETRIPGSDMNPYLTAASQLAAGLAGIEEGLDLAPPSTGDIYGDDRAPDVPSTIEAALAAFQGSEMLRTALGPEVIAHYSRAAEVEIEDYARAVTDYELRRGFEKA
ncbi:glutamine synthetase [Salipiger pallidus]|uniref:Glutamine synthetase n=1 Tax=Salipiger pallidus TaxID=1775170 RepID=A0A8J2ZKM2_9RHOB|nr:glutamine synthetase family protein [Salipiger pallidus]GGG73971.1 glutamine synthetase [Salipiger pallidus]